MDSGNSCSMQSSSTGGDEELDHSTRGESISSFFNPSPNFGSISAPHQNPTFFDPQNIDYNNNNSDLIWYSKGVKPQQNYSNFNNLSASSSSLPSSAQEGPFPNLSPSVPLHTSKSLSGSDHVLGVAKKSTKKRTRASRRAPTTVLTTDTTNFRQMVQEFTGIPAAPLSGTALYSRRLDLFSAAAALRSGAHLDTLGPLYPFRPSAHKVLSPFSSPAPQLPPSLLNSTMIDSTVPTTTTLGASASNNSNNYPQSSNHILNLQNQNIPLQLGGNAPMNFGDLSGFPTQENPSAGADNDHIRRWKSGETVKNNDGVEENLLASTFDGNINSRESQHISGYNLNISEKGMENAVSTGDGNVASWICSSD